MTDLVDSDLEGFFVASSTKPKKLSRPVRKAVSTNSRLIHEDDHDDNDYDGAALISCDDTNTSSENTPLQVCFVFVFFISFAIILISTERQVRQLVWYLRME